MSSTCDSAMAPAAWTVAMASLGRHNGASGSLCESHVVPQTVAIATCMSTSMGVQIWHIKGNLDMPSKCDDAMAPAAWAVAMAPLGRHHEIFESVCESHVVPQTVAISTCMSTSMGVLIWHIEGNLDMSSTCDGAMAPTPRTAAMASLGRHHGASEPVCEPHVVPQTVAIATCMHVHIDGSTDLAHQG